jgi:hypothetical protein
MQTAALFLALGGPSPEKRGVIGMWLLARRNHVISAYTADYTFHVETRLLGDDLLRGVFGTRAISGASNLTELPTPFALGAVNYCGGRKP